MLVDQPKRYLKQNISNLFIIIFCFPLFLSNFPSAAGLRFVRIFIVFTLFFQASKSINQVLTRHNLGNTLLASLFIIIVAGTLMSMIDPNVNSISDGIWWAWVTVTTVGYGDIVPSSNAGRLFGALLILMGIGLFTMLTASFATFFMAQDEKELQQQEKENIQKLHDIENRLFSLESKLDDLITSIKTKKD